MVGGLEACRRVAAVAVLAVSSVVPLGGPITTAAAPAPVADVVTSCSVTVGTATTDPVRAADAARALAAGYAATDCMPDASLLAAAEARATISLPGDAQGGTAVGGAVVGTSSGPATLGSARAATQGTATAATQSTATAASQGTATAPSVPTTSTVPTTSAAATTTTTPSSTETTTSTTRSGTSDTESGTVDGGTSSDRSDSGTSGSDGSSGSDGTTTGGTTTDGTAADGTTTAAGRFGWGQATRREDFDGDLSAWGVYDGPGHAGKGRRSPAAMSVANGIFTISGDATGTTGGMAWGDGARYGRWEARVKSPAGDPTYNAVMLLWPDAENFPVGGEVDFMEIGDETRQKTDFFLHYGASNHQLHGQVAIDATQWHNWAVEWAPDHITAYVDGQEWYTTRDTSAFPPGPMHLTLQLDWFPKGGGAVAPSTMSADWVRYYPIDGSGASGAITNSADTGVATGSTFVGPQVADTGGSDTGSTGDGDTGGTDSNGDDNSSVAGVTATSTTTVTPTASAKAATTASGTAGTATVSSAATTAVTTTATHAPPPSPR
jgi:Glycosyl hydrolases family 16